MIDAELLAILADPVDKEPLIYIEGQDVLYNPKARRLYRVRDSIPILLPDKATIVEEEEHRRLIGLAGFKEED